MKSRVSCISGRHADRALGDDAGVYREERSAAHHGRAGERQLDEALQPLGPTNIVETVTLGRDADH